MIARRWYVATYYDAEDNVTRECNFQASRREDAIKLARGYQRIYFGKLTSVRLIKEKIRKRRKKE